MKIEINIDDTLIERTKKTFSRRNVLITLTLACVLASAIAIAAPGDPVPNSFTAGDVISAAEVNDNFTEVTTQTGDLNARVNTLETTLTKDGGAIYMVTTATDVSSGTFGSAVRSCRDANDVLLSGGCSLSVTDGELISNHPTADGTFANTATPATWTCTGRNHHPTSLNILTSYAICLAVP